MGPKITLVYNGESSEWVVSYNDYHHGAGKTVGEALINLGNYLEGLRRDGRL